MFVNVNEITLPITASATPTAYALPDNIERFRVFNDCGATLLVKTETSTSTTLAAPVAGTRFSGSAMANQGVEVFNVNPNVQAVSIYSATGTGLVYIQFTYGQ